MVFEVDNTTKQLIETLQESIEGTISTLEDGQRVIKDLINSVKLSCDNLASADQADAISEDLSKARADLRKVATTDQLSETSTALGKTHELAQQGLTEVTRIKETLPKLTADIEKAGTAVLNAQKESHAQLTKRLSDFAESDAKARLVQLQELSGKLETLSSSLNAQIGGVSTAATSAIKVAEANKVALDAIVAYLSLPGYKRFFKGMEVSKDETAQ